MPFKGAALGQAATKYSMAIIGVGIDLADASRIRKILSGPLGERFKRRICTNRERAFCDRRLDSALAYGARFAAKEAFVKAIGAPAGMRWHDAEVVREAGPPSLVVTGKAAEIISYRGVRRIHLSITHERDMAVAVVVLED